MSAKRRKIGGINMEKRPDLDGLRFRMPGDDTVWLIDQGQRRGIVNEAYLAVFRNWNNIHLDIDVAGIDSGPDLDRNTILFRCHDDDRTFLLDRRTKRHVHSPPVMERFQFDY